MHVSIASEPLRPGQPNLDWGGATDRVAVVLDGLTEGEQTGCLHGTSWYVHQLGARLLLHAGAPEEMSLATSLSRAIEEVTRAHQDTCDLGHPGAPCSTVTMIRQRGSETDYLVLADSPLVLDVVGGPLVVIDEAEKAVSARENLGDPASDLASRIRRQQLFRNNAEGYWVAQVEPEAAAHALTGTVHNGHGALLASDGAALLVTDFHELKWEQLLELGYSDGPQAVISATRRAEASDPDRLRWPRFKTSDDAAAIVCLF